MTTIFMRHLKKEWAEKVSEVLLPRHLEDLRKSGLEEKTIIQARINSVSAEEAKRLLERKTEVGPGYVIPYPDKKGFTGVLNFKPDNPLSDKDGKPLKYLRPIGSRQHLYIPVPVWRILGNVKDPLIFTEGEKKSLKATQEGFPTIALSGVYGWLSNHEPIRDFEYISLIRRAVYVCFDSDKNKKPDVLKAEQRFAEFLTSRGAKAMIINFPQECS